MSFPRYPAYKDSGVEWLGEVPAHWEIKPIKAIASCNDEVLDESTPEDFEIEYVEIAGVTEGKIAEVTSVVFGDAPSRARRRVRDGDVLVSTVRTYLRAIAAVERPPENMIASTGFAVVRPRHVSPSYLRHVFLAEYLIAGVIARSVGVSYPAINASELMRLEVPVPPPEEQEALASFLDRETAKIDALIAEQERLIELLKEKRQAVISHAVTKGLDPDVSMKDSGVEWLGEVPAHWEVICLKRRWTVTDCKHITAEFVDEGIPLASIRECQGRYVALDEAKRTTLDFYRQLIEGGRQPRAGDLIFTRNATVGAVSQVKACHPPFALGQDVCLLRPNEPGQSSDYFQEVLLSPAVVAQLEQMMIGSTFKRVNVEEVRSIIVPAPPLQEQEAIAKFVTSEAERFDSLALEAETASRLLKERRAALISAAVTGQIDVRDAAPTR